MRDSTSKGSPSRFAELLPKGAGVRAVKLALGAALLAGAAGAQSAADWIIDTFAGSSGVEDNGPAGDAWLIAPIGVAADSGGNLYIAASGNHRIRKVDSSGVITTFAGTGVYGFGGDDGPAVDAQLRSPWSVAADSAGNLYIADTVNFRIRKVDSSGVITTFAGTGERGFGGDDGPAVDARLATPTGVTTDSAGNLYIADLGNQRIRKVDSSGVITTFAGTGERGFAGDGGPAVDARLTSPIGVMADGAGNLYISDANNFRIRKVDSSGIITTFAGTGVHGVAGDGGPAADAQLRGIYGLAADAGGNIYIAERTSHRIRKVDSSGVITTVAGNGTEGYGGDSGQAVAAQLKEPRGLAADADGNLYIADWGNHRIRKVDSSGVITTFSGPGENGDSGPAAHARLRYPQGVAADSAGNLFIADSNSHRIRKVDSSGVIATVAGTGDFGFGGDDGPAAHARLATPYDVAADADGNLFIADWGNHRVRKVDSSGVITTVAGTGESDFGGDGGPAGAAMLDTPRGVAADGNGNLFIADTFNHRVRKVDSSGVITTFAGSGERGFGGDDGPAVEAKLISPSGVATDGDGNLYIADWGNLRVRKVDSSGIITTFAGTGERGFTGDGGPAVDARLRPPAGVATDGDGNLYIADLGNQRIRKVDFSGIITTIAGDGTEGYAGDGGPAIDARLRSPYDVAADSDGNLYIADTFNHRIRILTPLTEPLLTEVLNTASFTPAVAPGSMASLFGGRLAPATTDSSAPSLRAELRGVRIEIIDAAGTSRAAQLLYVSPARINFLMPGETAVGAAVLRLTREAQEPVELAMMISPVAPGLFSANGTGDGAGVISALREAADGSRSNPPVLRYDAAAGQWVGVPLDLGGEGDRVSLTLFGTGIRGAGGVEAVQAAIGGSGVPVLSAGAQDGWAGLDRVEIGPLPRTLAGAGEVNVVVTANGVASNTVTIVF